MDPLHYSLEDPCFVLLPCYYDLKIISIFLPELIPHDRVNKSFQRRETDAIVECLLFPEFMAFEFLPGGVSVADARSGAEAVWIISPVGSEIEIQHQGNSNIVHRQLIFCVVDGVHDNSGGVDVVTDIFFIPVVVEFDAEAPFQIDHTLYQAISLHEEPEIDVYRFSVVQLEPIFG